MHIYIDELLELTLPCSVAPEAKSINYYFHHMQACWWQTCLALLYALQWYGSRSCPVSSHMLRRYSVHAA